MTPASNIPREVLSDHFQERLAGKRLLGGLFLTFEFDPGFFEQEILPVILDTPVSHAEVARLLQLEDALRNVHHGIAVFYDWSGLRTSDYKAPRLDTHRFPVRVNTGIFHPKNVLLLTEDAAPDEEGAKRKHLLVATMSANLTRSGWWENVETCHIEELEEGASTRLKEPLLTLLQRVERLTANKDAAETLKPYRRFLNTLEEASFKSKDGWLSPQFYVGGGADGEELANFLRAHIPRGSGYRLEVISPFFDKQATKSPLGALVKVLQPEEVRVSLPQDAFGAAQCSEELFEHVRNIGSGAEWGVLPDELLAMGRSADAAKRCVHAKVYRIFKPYPKTEFVFVSSANLTAPGHSGRGGNVETGVLLQIDPPSRPDFWLRSLKRKPSAFEAVASEDEPNVDAVVPVQIRYSWKTREATARYDGSEPSALITILGTGGPLGDPVRFKPGAWEPLSEGIAYGLGSELKSTSIITVRVEDGRESKILVQEEDMPLKPELLRMLPVRDILQYWSLLKPQQRQAFLDSRAQQLAPGELGALMAAMDDGVRLGNDIFDRCAGVFHAFAQLEERIFEALKDNRSRQAAALMFGERFDSLSTVLDRVLKGEDPATSGQDLTDVDRYLVLLCAVQLCDKVQRTTPQFWEEYAAQGAAIAQRLVQRNSLRAALCASNATEMPPFMNWFDEWFVKPAQPTEQA